MSVCRSVSGTFVLAGERQNRGFARRSGNAVHERFWLTWFVQILARSFTELDMNIQDEIEGR